MGDIIVMSYSVEENVNALKEHGLTVLENVLTTEEIDSYRGLILDYFKDGKNRCKGYGDGTQTIRPDAINVPYFKSFLNLFFNLSLILSLMTSWSIAPEANLSLISLYFFISLLR